MDIFPGMKIFTFQYTLLPNLYSILLSDLSSVIFKFLSYNDIFKLVNITSEVRNEPRTFSNIINLKNQKEITFFNYYFYIMNKKYDIERIYFMLQFKPILDLNRGYYSFQYIIEPPLFNAIKNNLPLDIINKFINMGSKLNYDDYEDAPLNVAIHYGHIEIVNMLIFHGANIHQVDEYSKNALITASEKGYIGIVQILLSTKGINVNYQNNDDNTHKWLGSGTALFRAAENGHKEIVMLLLNAGADPNLGFRTIDEGYYSDAISPLQMAILNGHVSIVNYLINNGANVNFPLKMEKKNKALNKYFSTTPLMDACNQGNPEIVKMLIKAGADTRYSFIFKEYNKNILYCPFKFTMECNNDINREAIVSQLIKLKHSLISFMNILVEFNLDKNTLNFDRVMIIITNIISTKKNLDVTDKYGRTALLISAHYGYYRLVKLLVKAGANIKHIDNNGNSAITITKNNNHRAIEAYLM